MKNTNEKSMCVCMSVCGWEHGAVGDHTFMYVRMYVYVTYMCVCVGGGGGVGVCILRNMGFSVLRNSCT